MVLFTPLTTELPIKSSQKNRIFETCLTTTDDVDCTDRPGRLFRAFVVPLTGHVSPGFQRLGGVDRSGGLGRLGVGRGAATTLTTPVIPMEQRALRANIAAWKRSKAVRCRGGPVAAATPQRVGAVVVYLSRIIGIQVEGVASDDAWGSEAAVVLLLG